MSSRKSPKVKVKKQKDRSKGTEEKVQRKGKLDGRSNERIRDVKFYKHCYVSSVFKRDEKRGSFEKVDLSPRFWASEFIQLALELFCSSNFLWRLLQ